MEVIKFSIKNRNIGQWVNTTKRTFKSTKLSIQVYKVDELYGKPTNLLNCMKLQILWNVQILWIQRISRIFNEFVRLHTVAHIVVIPQSVEHRRCFLADDAKFANLANCRIIQWKALVARNRLWGSEWCLDLPGYAWPDDPKSLKSETLVSKLLHTEILSTLQNARACSDKQLGWTHAA